MELVETPPQAAGVSKKLLISALEKYEINGFLPNFIKGALVGIRHSAKTSFMPKNVKQQNENENYLISDCYTTTSSLQSRQIDLDGCPKMRQSVSTNPSQKSV
jgi:hypothetical protein